MMFDKNTPDLTNNLKHEDAQELKEYCELQGFTEKETEVFVKNSLEKLYENI